MSLFLVAELQNSAHPFKYVHKPNQNQLCMSVLDVPYCPKTFLLLHCDVRGRPALGALCTAFCCTRRLGTARFPGQLPARCEVPVPAPRQLSSLWAVVLRLRGELGSKHDLFLPPLQLKTHKPSHFCLKVGSDGRQTGLWSSLASWVSPKKSSRLEC